MGKVIHIDSQESGGGTGVGFKFTATNYADLLNKVGMVENDLAVVYNSQGVWLVNRKLKGVYIYQSGVWEYANQELQDRLAAKLDSVASGFYINVDNADPLNPIVNFNPTPFLTGKNEDEVSTSSATFQSYLINSWGGLDNSREYRVYGTFICGCSAANRRVIVDVQSGGASVYPVLSEIEPKDSNNRHYVPYSFIASPIGGVIDVEILFSRSAGAGGAVATMYYADNNIDLKY